MVMEVEIKKGFKQSDLGLIPHDWEVIKINNVATIEGGYAFSSKKFLDEGDFQVVKMSNFYQGNLDLNRSASFLNKIDKAEENYLLKENEIVITLTGTVGKTDYGYTYRIRDEKKLLLNQRVARIISNENTNPIYLDFQLKTPTFFKQFFDVSKGGTGNQTNVGTKDVEEIKIFVPPTLEEQTLIATALSDADALITVTEKLIEKKKMLKQGAMQKLLAPKRNWSAKKLGDLIKLIPSGNYGFEKYRDGLISFPVVTTAHIDETDKWNNKAKHTRFYSSDTIKEYLPLEGDLIIVKASGSAQSIQSGKIGYVSKENEKSFLFSNFLMLLRPLAIYPRFLYYHLISHSVKSLLPSLVEASTYPNIRINEYISLMIPFPEQKEQIQIAQMLSDMDGEINALQKKLEKHHVIKQGMMQNLLTGKIRLV